MVAEVVAWSMKHAAKGIAPKTGFYGEAFGHDTWRREFAGKTLANGYRCPILKLKMFFFFPKFWSRVSPQMYYISIVGFLF